MSYKIISLSFFKKGAKKLNKKFPSFQQDLKDFGKELLENSTIGTSLGNDCYKVRLAIKSKGKG